MSSVLTTVFLDQLMFLLFDDCPDLGLSGVSTIAPEESHLVNTVGRRGRGRGGVPQVGGVE